MDNDEPPLSRTPTTPLFLVGKDSHGHWVARDQRGLCGGLFIDRAEALKFAMFENGHCPQAVIMVPGVLELDLSAKACPSQLHPSQPLPIQRPAAAPQAPLRRVA
jgi:hypothetical protein